MGGYSKSRAASPAPPPANPDQVLAAAGDSSFVAFVLLIWHALLSALRVVFVNRFTRAIGRAISAVWTGLWDGLVVPVARLLRRAWDSVVLPLCRGLQRVATGVWSPLWRFVQWLWTNGPVAAWNLCGRIVSRVADAVAHVWQHYVSRALNAVGDALRRVWNGVWYALSRVGHALYDAMVWALRHAGRGLSWLHDVLGRIARATYDAVAAVCRRAASVIRAVADAVGRALRWVWEALVLRVGRAVRTVFVEWLWRGALVPACRFAWNSVLAPCGRAVWNSLQRVWSAVERVCAWAWNTVKRIATAVWNAVERVLAQVWRAASAVGRAVGRALRSTADFTGRVLTRVWEAVTAALRRVADWVSRAWGWLSQNVFAPIGRAFSRAYAWLHDLATRGIDVLIRVLHRASDAVGRALRAVIDAVVRAYRAFTNSALATRLWELQAMARDYGERAFHAVVARVVRAARVVWDALGVPLTNALKRWGGRAYAWSVRAYAYLVARVWRRIILHWLWAAPWALYYGLQKRARLHLRSGHVVSEYSVDVSAGPAAAANLAVVTTTYADKHKRERVVLLPNRATYRLRVANDNPWPANATVNVDGERCGVWRCPAYTTLTIERPATKNSRFTFVEEERDAADGGDQSKGKDFKVPLGSIDGKTGVEKGKATNGLVAVEFAPCVTAEYRAHRYRVLQRAEVNWMRVAVVLTAKRANEQERNPLTNSVYDVLPQIMTFVGRDGAADYVLGAGLDQPNAAASGTADAKDDVVASHAPWRRFDAQAQALADEKQPLLGTSARGASAGAAANGGRVEPASNSGRGRAAGFSLYGRDELIDMFAFEQTRYMRAEVPMSHGHWLKLAAAYAKEQSERAAAYAIVEAARQAEREREERERKRQADLMEQYRVQREQQQREWRERQKPILDERYRRAVLRAEKSGKPVPARPADEDWSGWHALDDVSHGGPVVLLDDEEFVHEKVHRAGCGAGGGFDMVPTRRVKSAARPARPARRFANAYKATIGVDNAYDVPRGGGAAGGSVLPTIGFNAAPAVPTAPAPAAGAGGGGVLMGGIGAPAVSSAAAAAPAAVVVATPTPAPAAGGAGTDSPVPVSSGAAGGPSLFRRAYAIARTAAIVVPPTLVTGHSVAPTISGPQMRSAYHHFLSGAQGPPPPDPVAAARAAGIDGVAAAVAPAPAQEADQKAPLPKSRSRRAREQQQQMPSTSAASAGAAAAAAALAAAADPSSPRSRSSSAFGLAVGGRRGAGGSGAPGGAAAADDDEEYGTAMGENLPPPQPAGGADDKRADAAGAAEEHGNARGKNKAKGKAKAKAERKSDRKSDAKRDDAAGAAGEHEAPAAEMAQSSVSSSSLSASEAALLDRFKRGDISVKDFAALRSLRDRDTQLQLEAMQLPALRAKLGYSLDDFQDVMAESRAGATVYTGHSAQTFWGAAQLDVDQMRAVTVALRLRAIANDKLDARDNAGAGAAPAAAAAAAAAEAKADGGDVKIPAAGAAAAVPDANGVKVYVSAKSA